MNTAILSNFRILSIISLLTGILSLGLFFISTIENDTIRNYIIPMCGIVLPVVAIVCGSIDLYRIKAGRYNNKGRGFDINGIVLGSFVFLFFVCAVTVMSINPQFRFSNYG